MKKQLCFGLLTCLSVLSVWGQVQYPPKIVGDSLHAPFYHGVASGDPLSTAVIIWTRITPADVGNVEVVTYQVALDSGFQQIVTQNTFPTDSTLDFTVKVDVQGLLPATYYYYRFVTALGNTSVIGRTHTLPTGNATQFGMAVFSCSSIYSGYFNAYRRIGERNDIDLCVHLGDYLYDYVDPDEEVRIPMPYPTEPTTLTDWRNRHNYYHLDEDLRYAHERHPWVILWDNHDLGGKSPLSAPTRAFREWLPIRVNNTGAPNDLYRAFEIGNLADFIIADVSTYRNQDTFPDGTYNLLGNAQWEWFIQKIKNSDARWRLFGSQKMTGGWYTNGIPQSVLDLVPNDGSVFDDTSWDGFVTTRNRLFDTLAIYNIQNVMALSGDAHVSMAMDLVKNPHDSTQYDPSTGEDAVGVEMLPASISRGNVDEAGVTGNLATAFNNISLGANPQHVFSELTSHGYGYLHINPDSITATFMYSPILASTQTEITGTTWVFKQNENHWHRYITSGIETPFPVLPLVLYPVPATDFLHFDHTFTPAATYQIFTLPEGKMATKGLYSPNIATAGLSAGMYFIMIMDNGKVWGTKWVKE